MAMNVEAGDQHDPERGSIPMQNISHTGPSSSFSPLAVNRTKSTTQRLVAALSVGRAPRSKPIDAERTERREKEWNPRLVDGFPRASAFIVRDKEKGSALFRRFDAASMRNLLLLQARVASLTAQQEAFDDEDYRATHQPTSDKDSDDVKARLQNLKKRLQIWKNDDKLIGREDEISPVSKTYDESGLPRRIRDIALCLDYPLESLVPLSTNALDNHPWDNDQLRYSYVFKGHDRPTVGKLLEGNLKSRLEKITEIVAYRLGRDKPTLREYLGDFRHHANTYTNALEIILQNSIIASLSRHIVPDQLVRFNMSWEEMEIFGNHEVWKQEQEKWELSREKELNRGTTDPGEWPYSFISEFWRRKLAERYQVAMDLKNALKEYQEALITQRTLFQFPEPAERTKVTQRKWFTGALDEDEIPQFVDGSADIFDADMVSLGTIGEEDYISKHMPQWIPSFFVATKRSDKKIRYVSEKKVNRVVETINGAAAIGFLVVAVWVLSVVSKYKTDKGIQATERELAVMTAFIVAFAIWVRFLTSLGRKEVFGAVAAYAAVLVVFVGSA